MLAWLSENIGTILIVAVLLAIVAAIVVKLARDKKQGKSTCGCSCPGCHGGSCGGRSGCH